MNDDTSKFHRVLHILEQGGSVQLPTGHKVVMNSDGYFCVEGVCGSDPVLLNLDLSINTLIDECEKLTSDYLWTRVLVPARGSRK